MFKTTNSKGFIQYVDDNGGEICVSCQRRYHNSGEGAICRQCDEQASLVSNAEYPALPAEE